jgi:hypothetical protein
MKDALAADVCGQAVRHQTLRHTERRIDMRSSPPSKKHKQLVDRIAAQPLTTEDLYSTSKPPEWEDIIAWWDEMVTEARMLSMHRYRKESHSG